MNTKKIISAVLSAAMLATSAAAAVYANAADLGPAENKVEDALLAAIDSGDSSESYTIVIRIKDTIDKAAIKASAEAETSAYMNTLDTASMTSGQIEATRNDKYTDLYTTGLINAVNERNAPLRSYGIEFINDEHYSIEDTLIARACAEDIFKIAKEDIVRSVELRDGIAVPAPTGVDGPEKKIQPVYLCDELRDFVNSGTGSRLVSIRIAPAADNKIYEDAEAYADAQMEQIGQYMSNEDMYNDYRGSLMHNYIMEHQADINKEVVRAFAEKYGLTVTSQNNDSPSLTAEVTASQLKSMLDDENVLAVVPGETVEEPTEGPTRPILAPPPGGSDEPIKEIQPIVLSDELSDFVKSGTGSRLLTIRVTPTEDNQAYADAEAYADAQMEQIGEYMSNETMYNDYRSKALHSYLMSHTADINKYAIEAFAGKYGLTVTAQDNNASALTAEVTAAQLRTMLDDENVIAVTLASETEPATSGPTTPTISAPVNTIGSKVKGDANLDGKVTVSDAVAVLQYIANQKKYPLSADGIRNADIDGISGITGGDAIAIQKIDAGVAITARTPEEEFIDLLVADDPEFSDHGLIYAPDLKYDAILGACNGQRDVLIIYGPRYPEDIKEVKKEFYWTNETHSYFEWDSIFTKDQINSKDYILITDGELCHNGDILCVTPWKSAALKTESGKEVRIAVFIEGLPVGMYYPPEGSEKWGIEEYKAYLSEAGSIETPTCYG
jgi:hypothetical protein